MTPEGRIKRMVTKGLKDIQRRYPGKLWYRMPVTRGMGLPWLDYHCCVGGPSEGRTVAIEAKRDIEHCLTLQQQMIKRELEEAGAVVLVVYDEETARNALVIIEAMICPEAS